MHPTTMKKSRTNNNVTGLKHDAKRLVDALTTSESEALKQILQFLPSRGLEVGLMLNSLKERLKAEYASFPVIHTFTGDLEFLPLTLPTERLLACTENEKYDILTAYLEHKVHSALRCLAGLESALNGDAEQVVIDVLTGLLGVNQSNDTPMTTQARAVSLSMFQGSGQEDTASVGGSENLRCST